MTILALANTPYDGLSDTVASTSSVYPFIRDTTLSPSGIAFAAENSAGLMSLKFALPTTALWVHHRYFRNRTTNSGANFGQGNMWTLFNSNGQLICSLNLGVNTQRIQVTVYGDTIVTSTGNYKLSDLTSNTYFDVKLVVNNTSITANLYVDYLLIGTATAANTTGLKIYPTHLCMEHACMQQTNGGAQDGWGEVIVTDGEDTRDMKLTTYEPVAQGASTQWIGSIEDIRQSRNGRFLVADQIGIRESWTVNTYAGSTASLLEVRAIVNKVDAHVGTPDPGLPGKIAPFLRIGSTNYDGSDHTPVTDYPIMQEWTVNPATGVAWTFAELAAGFQFGVRAAA